MTDFTPLTIKRALDELPTLEHNYDYVIKEIKGAATSSHSLRAVFTVTENNDSLEIVFNHLDLSVATKRRVVLAGDVPFLLLAFYYTVKDELVSLLNILLSVDGLVIVGDIKSNDIIDPDTQYIGQKIFDRLAKAAYEKGLISA